MKEQEYFFDKYYLRKMIGIIPSHFDLLIKNHPECRETPEGYPLFAMLSAFYKAFVQLHHVNSKMGDEDVSKLQLNMQREKLTKERIHNQTKLGMLILKEEAMERVLRFVQAINSTIKNSIQITATDLVNQTFANKREAEIFLTEKYNKAINFLEENAELLEWEQDGSIYLTGTRLKKLEQLDKELDAVLGDLEAE